MAEKKTVSQKARNKSFRNWTYGNLTCFSQEHMQTFGYLASMLPVGRHQLLHYHSLACWHA